MIVKISGLESVQYVQVVGIGNNVLTENRQRHIGDAVTFILFVIYHLGAPKNHPLHAGKPESSGG